MSVIIKAEGLSKLYRLGIVSSKSITMDVQRWWARTRGKEDPFIKIGRVNDLKNKDNSEYVWALNNLNFEINSGEVIGIIGKNGAGKSTLLKILSRVTSPTKGFVKVKGRVASLLEVGTGFHNDLTGRENVFLNGSILGMTKDEIKGKFDAIVDFSGIEKYIDTPVKRYSSGMFVRLAFAVAAHLDPEILIVDEVLAVGDAEFQKKCIGKMRDVSLNEGRTVLIVSHLMGVIAQLCEKAILIEKGEIEMIDSAKEVVNHYIKNISRSNPNMLTEFSPNRESKIFISKVMPVNSNEEFTDSFAHTEPVLFGISFTVNEFIRGSVLSVFVKDKFERKIFTTDFNLDDKMKTPGVYNVSLQIPGHFLKPGEYSAGAAIHLPNVAYIDLIESACFFHIVDVGSAHTIYKDADLGCVFVEGNWKII